MNKKILHTASFRDGLREVIGMIRSRKQGLSETRHILVVPENYTLFAESELLRQTAGAFDAEVLTFARLFYKVCGKTEYLSREGAIMLLRSICQSTKLECYNRSAHYTGFAERVYETINGLLDRGVDILATDAEGADAAKMKDIKKIYSEYIRRTEGRYIDRAGRLEMLAAEAANGGYISNCRFYIANFMSFTAGEKKVIDALAENSAGVIISVPDMPFVPSLERTEAEVYDCAGTVGALKAVAQRLREAGVNGLRYSDACVVAPQAGYCEAQRIFAEYGVPFYTDHSYILKDHLLSEYVLTLIEIIEKRYRRGSVCTLVKNMYSGVSKPSADLFENFVCEYNIDYLGFLEPFDPAKYGQADDAEACSLFAAAEAIRKEIADKLEKLERRYKKISTSAHFSAFVRTALSMAAKAVPSASVSAEAYTENAGARIEEILLLIEKILEDEPHKPSFIKELFEEGLAAEKLARIPNRADSVVIGDESAFRGGSFRYVFVIGLNDGVLPRPNEDRSLLAGSYPVGDDINESETDLTQLVLGNPEKLFLAYDSGAEGGMSCFLKSFIDAYRPRIKMNSAAAEQSALEYELDEPLLLRTCSCFASAAETFINCISSQKITGQTPPATRLLYSALADTDVEKYINRSHPPDIADCGSLFFYGDTVSVSRLQKYFECPYAHFLKYGLRAEERKDSDLKVNDVGTIMHEVVEIFAKQRERWHETPLLVAEILDGVFASKIKLSVKISKDVRERLYNESVKACEVLKRHLSGGSFERLGEEISFGSDGKFGSLRLTAGSREITLTGSVDYADTFGEFIRVIDYKTGDAKFDFADVYYGRRIQLPVYMQVFIENGYRPAGFFYFPFSYSWSDGEAIRRFSGVFNEAEEILVAMESDLSLGVSGKILRVKTALKEGGLVVSGKCDHAFDEDGLRSVCNYAVGAARVAIEEIAEGYIARRPYKKGRKTACDYCEYAPACEKREYRTYKSGTTVSGFMSGKGDYKKGAGEDGV